MRPRQVAQYPHELITYGGNGSVFSNWAQYRLTMRYLSRTTDTQGRGGGTRWAVRAPV